MFVLLLLQLLIVGPSASRFGSLFAFSFGWFWVWDLSWDGYSRGFDPTPIEARGVMGHVMARHHAP